MKLCCGTIMNTIGLGTGKYYICNKCGSMQYPLTINKEENVSIQGKGK